MLKSLSRTTLLAVCVSGCVEANDESQIASAETEAPCVPGRLVCGPNSQGQWCPGDGTALQIPAECPYIRIKAWGGGGIGGTSETVNTGGGGGFAQLLMDNVPGGTKMKLRAARHVTDNCGYEGAESYARRIDGGSDGPLLLVAGGGGSAGRPYPLFATVTVSGRGGAGGGQAGEGAGTAMGGRGGSSTAPGAGGRCGGSGCIPGHVGHSPDPHPSGTGWLTTSGGGYGGEFSGCAAGGLGGYGLFGGGGGAYRTFGPPWEHYAAGGGGGGSYFADFAPNAKGTLITGNWDEPGNASDPDRGDSGWGATSKSSGQPGRVIVDWSDKQFTGGSCSSDADCGAGDVCESCVLGQGQCVPGCRSDADCGPAQHCTQVTCAACPCPMSCE